MGRLHIGRFLLAIVFGWCLGVQGDRLQLGQQESSKGQAEPVSERLEEHAYLFKRAPEHDEAAPNLETASATAAAMTAAKATLTIAVISNNRKDSLRRLCASVLKADYRLKGAYFDRVDLIFNLEASSDRSLMAFVSEFQWPHGFKLIRHRTLKAGLIRAVSESWYPSSPADHGLLLEDDIEVSAHYFSWLTKALLALARDPDPRVVGISLYSPVLTETTNPKRPFNATDLIRKIKGDRHRESPYMMQTPCSWGAVYFASSWTEFMAYLQLRLQTVAVDTIGTKRRKRRLKDEQSNSTRQRALTYSTSGIYEEEQKGASRHVEDVPIENSRVNGWSVSWKKFYFELMYAKGQYLMYPNFELGSLSTNHMERGEHIKSANGAQKQLFQVPLLRDATSVERLEIQSVASLPVLNLFGVPWMEERQLRRDLGDMADGKRRPPPRWLHPGSGSKLCERFPHHVHSSFVDESSLTLIISTYNRFEVLGEMLSYYSASPIISTIIVTWHNTEIHPPTSMARIRGTFVFFHNPETDTLNNRFNPLLQITTKGVLSLDDDAKLHLQDVFNLFVAWKQNPQHLLGFSPRWLDHRHNNASQFIYRYHSEDTFGAKPHEGYSLMLTRSLLMHRDYLSLYTCGGVSDDLGGVMSGPHFRLRSLILNTVRSEQNCEDIGINFIAASALRSRVHSTNANSSNANEPNFAAPLFLSPMHRIGDFGTSVAKKRAGYFGLHGKPNHDATRSRCVNEFHDAFMAETGGVPMGVQTRIITATATPGPPGVASSGATVVLAEERYPDTGLRKRLHEDCKDLDDFSDDPESACSWQLPAADGGFHFSAVWRDDGTNLLKVIEMPRVKVTMSRTEANEPPRKPEKKTTPAKSAKKDGGQSSSSGAGKSSSSGAGKSSSSKKGGGKSSSPKKTKKSSNTKGKKKGKK